jgi:phage gp29-like protein
MVDKTLDPVETDELGVGTPQKGSPPATRILVSAGASVQERYRHGVSRRLTAFKLASVLAENDQGLPGRMVELQEEMLEKDTRMRSALAVRMAAVLSTKWEILPSDEDDEEAVDVAKQFEADFRQANHRQLMMWQLEAVAKPFAVTWQVWGYREGRVAPIKWKRVSQKRFRWDFEEDQLLIMPKADMSTAEPLPPYETVRTVYQDVPDHIMRSGLLRCLMWTFLFKSDTLKDWLALTEKWGIPGRVAKIPRGDYLDRDILRKVRADVRSIGADLSAVLPNDATLETFAGPGGQVMQKELVEYLDRAIVQVILGHELSAQAANGGGPYGVSAAKEVRQDIRQSDCISLDETLERDVALPYVGFNLGWNKLHLTPKFKHAYEEEIDQKALSEVWTKIAERFPGLPFSKTQIRSTMNIAVPKGVDMSKESDAVFGVAQTAVAVAQGLTQPQLPLSVGQEEGGSGSPDQAVVPIGTENAADGTETLDASPSRRPAPSHDTIAQLVSHAVAQTEAEMVKLGAPLRKLVEQAAAESWTVDYLASQITQLYRRLSLSRTTKVLGDKLIVARLYGRVSRKA